MTAPAVEQPGEILPRPTGIFAALLAFKAEAPTLPKDRTATVPTRSGGQYTYRYTDLGTIAKLIDPLLLKHGLAWNTLPTGTQAEPKLAYVLTHEPSGQQISGEMPLFGVDSSQSHGSATTYGRRYAKVAVLDLVADEDDDGAAAASGVEAAAARVAHGVDLRQDAKGLRDDAINAARVAVGLPRLEKPWASLINVPEEKAAEFAKALAAARDAQ